MAYEIQRLTEVRCTGGIGLMNVPLVRRQMAFAENDFDESGFAASIIGWEKI